MIRARNLPQWASYATLLLLVSVASLRSPGFFSVGVLTGLFTDQCMLGVVAVGMTFVILSGGIDLSVGAVAAFSATLIASLVGAGWHPLAAMLVSVGIATAFGAVQGAITAWYRLPPFLVTLAGMFLARGSAFAVLEHSREIEHPFYERLWDWRVPLSDTVRLPVETWVLLAVFALAWVIQRRTRLGRTIYAMGGDPASALLMGLPVRRATVLVYAGSGLCAGLAGVLATAIMESGNPAAARGLELEAITCVVIGGTLLRGGIGGVGGTLAGLLSYATLQAAIVFDGRLDVSWTRIVMGALLLAYILLQRGLVRRAEGR